MYNTTNVRAACDVAQSQGWDVLSATSIPPMPRFGALAQTWVLLVKDGEARVTNLLFKEDGEPHSEFSHGWYFLSDANGEIGKAEKAYVERCRRSWLDWRIHEDPTTR